jgi:hypothetical protein
MKSMKDMEIKLVRMMACSNSTNRKKPNQNCRKKAQNGSALRLLRFFAAISHLLLQDTEVPKWEACWCAA